MQRPILQRYGATEFGAIFKMRLDDKTVPEGTVGEIASGVDVRLSEGDEGEVLVKSPVRLLIYHLRNCAKEI
jgi:malonyl-CoA/methylmalonyl-CoA synthetase